MLYDSDASADFNRDVARREVVQAEARVLAYLQATSRAVEDCRKDNGPYDFIAKRGRDSYRIDVKADSWIDSTGNIAFERHHTWRVGSSWYGWGMFRALDIVAYVGAVSWWCWFLDLPKLRNVALYQGRLWKPYQRSNKRGAYVTHGLLIPVREARAYGAVRKTVSLVRY